MKAIVAASFLVASFAVQAQAPGAPSKPPSQAPAAGSAPAPQSGSQRGGFIAPLVDIRIQGEGISLPKGVGEGADPAAPEKPPARK